MHVLGREERFICFRFCVVAKYKRFSFSSDGFYELTLCYSGMKLTHRVVKLENIVALNITDAQMRELLA